jgi:Helicase HerA, central domain
MVMVLTRWESSTAPAVAIETTEQQTYAVFWGGIIPAIPDLISTEQFRSGMSYETALNQLLQAQQRWIQQLHGESRFTLALRIITTGDSQKDLIFGLVGKTEGKVEAETIIAARNFFNKIRDTFPNGYPLQPCRNLEELAQLRLPFLPDDTGTLAEFRRTITQLQTITSKDIPDKVGVQINSWIPQASNFQDLFRALLCHPTLAAVSINLRPTQLTRQESTYLAEQARLYANITNLTRGESFQMQAMSSNVQYQEKLVEAEQASNSWTRLQNSWRSPFEMTVSIIAESALPQSIIAALQSAVNGKPATENQVSGTGEVEIAQREAQKMAVRQNWVDLTLHRWANTYNLDRLPWLFSPEEVHCLLRLPISDRTGVWGLPSAPGANDARRPAKISDSTAEIAIGTLHLSKKLITQHLLICGVPGSGKTNTSLYLLEILWRLHRIPWMVLEPAKTEYRGLKAVDSLKDDLLIFSLGDERVAPLRFNPFEVPPTINLNSHLGALIDLFSVSMSMWGPLPNVVEQLIIEAYKRKGFTSLGDNSKLKPPCFSDLAVLIPEIVPKLGYSQESTDEILAAVSVRINKFRRGPLGKMLDTTESVPFELLMQRPAILEMSQITNSDDRAFVMGLILNRCYQYWTARRHQATGELKHLLLIEEAHNLLANASESTSQEQANPKGKAVKNFANMLAEVRGFGQGIAIAEQNPDGLVPDVMVNTNTKLAHRVVEAKNRESLSRSMLMTPQQEKSLASLGVGQMLYYIGGSPEPSLTNAPNFKDDATNKFNPRLTDEEIHLSFQAFRSQYSSIYSPPVGCPTDTKLAACVEQGADLAQSLLENPQYKIFKTDLILQLLAAPFGADATDAARQVFGQILIEHGANHLSVEQVEGILNSATSLLALEAVKEKAKVHGWLGNQIEQAHRLLVMAIFNPSPQVQDEWIKICQIPEHLLQMGIPHPEYSNCLAPGVFRYENKIFLEGDRTTFEQDIDEDIPLDIALQNWAETAPIYDLLNDEFKESLLICLAIQLTKNNPEDLIFFLEGEEEIDESDSEIEEAMSWRYLLVERDLSLSEIVNAIIKVFSLKPEEVLVINDEKELDIEISENIKLLCEKNTVDGDFKISLSIHLNNINLQELTEEIGNELVIVGNLCNFISCKCLIFEPVTERKDENSCLLVHSLNNIQEVYLNLDKLADENYVID